MEDTVFIRGGAEKDTWQSGFLHLTITDLETLPTCLKRDELHRQLLAQCIAWPLELAPTRSRRAILPDPLPLVSGVPRSHPSVASCIPDALRDGIDALRVIGDA